MTFTNSNEISILLVEDNQDHADLAIEAFKTLKIPNTIYHVLDGEEALNFLKKKSGTSDFKNEPKPDLIILDLKLPKMDGFEVLEQLKTDKDLRKIPVIVLSTSEDQRDLQNAYEKHVNSYLVKPVNFQKFNDLINNIGTYWLQTNRYPC